MSCLFCKIIAGEIPCGKVYEDDTVLAFSDISPAAPVHVLIVPKEHIQSANELEPRHDALLAHIFSVVRRIAEERGFFGNGYRIVNNCGLDGGQSVPHLHFHLLAGRELGWPPG